MPSLNLAWLPTPSVKICSQTIFMIGPLKDMKIVGVAWNDNGVRPMGSLFSSKFKINDPTILDPS